MSTIQILFGVFVACVLAVVLARQYRREDAKRADQGRVLFEPVFSLFEKPDLQRGETAGVWTLSGRYLNHYFQLKSVADTLATRKLPSLWLMVTLPEPQPVSAITDVMMRAAGISSFSNFDFLQHTLARPAGFPEQATIRSDVDETSPVVALMAPHIAIFQNSRGKELLVSPKGLRIVVQLAEGDKARYGVFREANFAGTTVAVDLAVQIMDTLINLRNDIRDHAPT